jgi:hypothetical protein
MFDLTNKIAGRACYSSGQNTEWQGEYTGKLRALSHEKKVAGYWLRNENRLAA